MALCQWTDEKEGGEGAGEGSGEVKMTVQYKESVLSLISSWNLYISVYLTFTCTDQSATCQKLQKSFSIIDIVYILEQ